MENFKLIKLRDNIEDSGTIDSSALFSNFIKEFITLVSKKIDGEKLLINKNEEISYLLNQLIDILISIKNKSIVDIDKKLQELNIDKVFTKDEINELFLLKNTYRIQYPIDIGVNGALYKNNNEPGICYYDKLNDEWVFNTRTNKIILKK